ncbi:C2 calcium-dependent membrane-targeting protein [Tanacetum coccineum]
MPTSELRRSGRVKSKSPVVEENTASDAYSVDDESSGDDFVDGNGKGIEVGNRVAKRGSGSNVSHSSDDKGKRVMESNSGAVKKRKKSDIIGADKEKGESSKASTSKPKKGKGKKPYVFQTRTTPKPLYNAIVTLKPIQKACLARIGFADLLDFKVDGIPSKLGFYVANNFNADTMEIRLKDTSIVITQQLIGEMLGIKNEGVDITTEVNANDDEMVKDWDAQFKKGKLLKEKEYEEINAGGIGKGELQGRFVEEDDPMPEDEDQYRASLHYKNVVNEGNSGSDLNRDNNDEPHQVNTLQEAVDNNSKDYDSSMFALGPATQKEVFTRVDKVVEEFEITDRNTPVLGSANQLEPIKAVPVSMCKPVLKDEDVVHGRGKRKYTKSQAARSPFMSRVTDINATESKDEKRVEKFLLNKIRIDQSAILFENETGTKASRKQMESLVNGENIDNAVVDAWSEYLNSLESLRGENSMSRFFLPTFIVNLKKTLILRDCAEALYENFLDYFRYCGTEYRRYSIWSVTLTSDSVRINDYSMNTAPVIRKATVSERAGRQNMINLVDLVFIPVSNYGHKFLICINMKFPAVNLIDSKNNLTKECYHKSIIVTNTNDMVVATVLQKSFCGYLDRLNPNKAAAVLRVEVKREDFYWQTDKRPNDSGVFLMRHMEAYMGTIISKWACGLETEGRKQNTMLGRLRKRYAATLLLSKCNMHSYIVRAQLEGIQVAEGPVKRMKLPARGK